MKKIIVSLIAVGLLATVTVQANDPSKKGLKKQQVSNAIVSKVVVTADQSSFTGKCPHTVKFTATIYSTGTGTVQFKWIRSDGGHQAHNPSVTLGGTGTDTVTYEWRLGKNFQGWVAMQTITPNQVKSNNANFQITCN
jgi:hypothetical protein